VPTLTPQPYFASELNASAIFPRRLSQPEEVVHGIIYLLENSMMNDFELRVDGGWRGVTNWAGSKDRECTLLTPTIRRVLILCSPRERALVGVKGPFTVSYRLVWLASHPGFGQCTSISNEHLCMAHSRSVSQQPSP
jgi:hypothetical protein